MKAILLKYYDNFVKMTNSIHQKGRSTLHEANSALPLTLVIGLGNPILGDDGLGWCVVKSVEQSYKELLEAQPKNHIGANDQIQFEYLSLGGLSLMEHMVGFDRVILVDAITTGKDSIGTVHICDMDVFPNYAVNHLSSAHDTTLHQALQIGKAMGAKTPDKIYVVTIEANITYEFSEDISQPILAAIPEAVKIVMEEIK